jgi:hypothetical protein
MKIPTYPEDRDFTAWAASVDPKVWEKLDLHAARMGWEAHRAHVPLPMVALHEPYLDALRAIETGASCQLAAKGDWHAIVVELQQIAHNAIEG